MLGRSECDCQNFIFYKAIHSLCHFYCIFIYSNRNSCYFHRFHWKGIQTEQEMLKGGTSSLAASHYELMVTFEQCLKTWSIQPIQPSHSSSQPVLFWGVPSSGYPAALLGILACSPWLPVSPPVWPTQQSPSLSLTASWGHFSCFHHSHVLQAFSLMLASELGLSLSCLLFTCWLTVCLASLSPSQWRSSWLLLWLDWILVTFSPILTVTLLLLSFPTVCSLIQAWFYTPNSGLLSSSG